MKKYNDVSWPPENVKDLKPEYKTKKENMRFPILKQALEKILKK